MVLKGFSSLNESVIYNSMAFVFPTGPQRPKHHVHSVWGHSWLMVLVSSFGSLKQL